MSPQTTIAPDIAAEIGRWLAYLGSERRMSPKTLEAYERDVGQFLAFLADHLGGPPGLKGLAKLTPADVRAFMASRRAGGAGNRTLMRSLAGTRSFARFLERDGKGKVGALAAIRTPKLARSLPKPLAIKDAKRMTETDLREGDSRAPWIAARDAAVLGLLYGSGLRIAEALSLKREQAPRPNTGDAITVTGKGNKARMVPVLPQDAKLIADYSALCPLDLPPDGPLFVGAVRCCRALCNWRWRGCAARWACPIRRRRMRCGTPSPPIFWRAAAICVRYRSCSATLPCRPRRFTRRSTANVCWKFTPQRIPALRICPRFRICPGVINTS